MNKKETKSKQEETKRNRRNEIKQETNKNK